MTDDLFDYCEPARVMSPCVNVCALDAATGWCTGCGRTGDEIAVWSSVTDGERQEILDRLAPRMQRLATARSARTGD